jgi:integrase
MNNLQNAVNDYLTLRRGLGFKLGRIETHLRKFVVFMAGKKTTRITAALALEFAVEAAKLAPCTKGYRLSAVRGFARHHLATDAATEIPPPGLLPCDSMRPQPYLYSDAEILRLLAGAKAYPSWDRYRNPLWNRFRAETYYCIFGLLAVTGMRVGEVVNLQPGDIDWTEGVLTIRKTKFGKSRLIPLHKTTLKAITVFMKHRDRFFGQQPSSPGLSYLFVTSHGTKLKISAVNRLFLIISRKIGLRAPAARRGPRIHDLRHHFAIETLLRWYRQGENPDRLLPVLSTYLGHTNVSGTYWYLSCTPELMQAAGQRLERRWKGVR